MCAVCAVCTRLMLVVSSFHTVIPSYHNLNVYFSIRMRCIHKHNCCTALALAAACSTSKIYIIWILCECIDIAMLRCAMPCYENFYNLYYIGNQNGIIFIIANCCAVVPHTYNLHAALKKERYGVGFYG